MGASRQRWVRRSAVAAAVGFAGLGLFQLALAAGAPLGRAAWGGAEDRLSVGLRVGSAVSVLFYVLAAAVILRRAGLRVRPVSEGFARRGTWVLVVVLALSAVANLLSQSPWERFVLAPSGLVLAVLCWTVAAGRGAQDARRSRRSAALPSPRWAARR